MFKVITALVVTMVSTIAFAKYQQGYFRKDGTYVQGHFKTESNDTKNDNYSTKGNTSPYTGEKGTHDRDEVSGIDNDDE